MASNAKELYVRAVFEDAMSAPMLDAGKAAGAALAGGFAAAGAGIAAGLGVAITSAADFTASMAEVKSLGLSDEQFAPLTQGVSDLAATMGLDAKDATKALYDAISAGQDPANALEFLATAGKAAVAGITDMSSAGSALSVVMNSFGPSVGSASHVADVLFQTVKQGVTTFPELASSIGNVSGLAASMGASFEETASTVAQLTTKGATTATAVTQLRAAMTALSAGGADMTKVLAAMGFSSGKAAIDALGLQGTLEGIRAKSDELGVPLAKVLGSVEAVGAVLNTTGDNAAKARERLATFGDVGGNVAGAFETINASASRQFDLLKSQLAGIGRDVGMALLPAVGQLLAAGNSFLTSLAPVIATFQAQIGPLITTLTAAMGALWSGLVQLAAFLSPVLLPILGVLAVMVGLTLTTAFASAAASAALWAAQLVLGGVVSIVSFIGSLVLMAPSIYAAAAAFLTGGIPALMTYMASIGVVVPANLAAGASFLSGLIPGIVAAAGTFFGTMIPAAIAAAATFLTTTVPSVLATGAAFLTGLIPALVATVASIAATAAGFLAGLVPALVAANASLVATIAGAVTTAATFLTTTLPAIIATAAGFLVTLVPAVWAAVTSFIAGIIPAAIAVVGGLLAMIPAAIAAAGGFLSMAATAAVAFAGIVVGAISAAIGVVVALWPIILVAGLIGLAIYAVYKNWGAIWGAIVKYTSAAAGAIFKGIAWLGKTIMDIVKKALGVVAKIFKAVFGNVLKIAKEFVSKIAGGMRRGVASMASKVMGIIEKLGDKLWEGLKAIVDSILDLLRSIPGVDAILTGLSNAGSGVRKFIAGFKGAFDEGGDDAGSGFVDSLTTSIDAGLEAAGIDFSVKETLGGMMPELPGAAAGGGGGGGAAADNPAGIWSGTDSKGAWTIDPGTGAKIYEAGSVGALQQQNAASDKAARDAGKQAAAGSGARSGVGAAVENNIAPKSAVDLAKAFSDAVSASIAAINELVGARIPSPDQYAPKLEAIKGFWLAVADMFADTFRYGAETDRGKAAAGALIKSDLEGIGLGADAMEKVFKALDTVTGFMGKLSAIQKMPLLAALEPVRAFALSALAIGKELAAGLDKAGAELVGPVADALGKTVDALSKAAELLSKPVKGSGPDDAARGALESILKWVGGFAASLLKGDGYDLTAAPDTTTANLNLVKDVMSALSNGVDMMQKAAAFLSQDWRKLKPLSDDARASMVAALQSIGTFSAGLIKGDGYDLTKDRERVGADLALTKDVLSTLAAGVDAFTKVIDFGAKAEKFKTVSADTFAAVRGVLLEISAFSSGLLRGPGYDLTKDRETVKADLALVRDVLQTIAVGVDLFTKAGGLDPAKITAIAAGQIEIVVDNVSSIIENLSGLALGFFEADGTMRQYLANLKPFAEAASGAVDLFAKIAAIGLDKVSAFAADTLAAVEANARSILDAVSKIAGTWTDADGVLLPLLLVLKSFADQAGAAVDLFIKAAAVGVDWEKATAISASALDAVSQNITGMLDAIVGIAVRWTDAEDKLLPIIGNIKSFADSAGDAVELVEKAAGIGVKWAEAQSISADVLSMIDGNITAMLGTIARLAAGYVDADDKLLPIIGHIKAFAEAAGAAVDLVISAAASAVEWVKVSAIPADKLATVADNIRAILDALKAQLTAWILADGTMDPLLDQIKTYAETASAAVELVIKGANIGAELAKASAANADQMRVAGDNILLALDEVKRLAATFDSLDSDIREKLFDKIKSFSESAATAVELILKGAGLSEALAKVKPIGRATFADVANHILYSVEELERAFVGVSAETMARVQKIAEAAGPVADAIAKALDAFSMENLLKSGFIDTKTRSAHSARAASTRAQNFANQVKAGISLIFSTLKSAIADAGAVDPAIAANALALTSAYAPLLDLLERMAALNFNLNKIRQIAMVPGILAYGANGAVGGAGAPSGTGGGSGPAGGGMLLTGPATLTGPVSFNGTMVNNIYLDGKIITSTVTSGAHNRGRNKNYKTGRGA